MKRTLLTLVLACALVLGAVAAPALSLRPYRPKPVDFELSAPADRARVHAARTAGVISSVIDAPRRFNLVGMRWSGRAKPLIAIRVRRSGARWSAWTPVAGHPDGGPDGAERGRRSLSSPLWAGEADQLQYRLSRPVADLRLHFVNTTGSSSRLERARTAVAARASSVAVALVGLVGPAGAQEPAPAIVPRSAWGAQDCAPRQAPTYGEVKAAFVHHTVTANGYTREQAPAAVLAICRYHRNSNGWNDIGYNFLVDTYGTVYEGRAGGIGRAVIGAQAQGFNAGATGIANIGTHSTLPQSPAALDAIARLIRWKLPLHGQPTAGSVALTSAGGASNRFGRGEEVTLSRVSGHRDGNATSCPGQALYDQLPDLRARVGGVGPTAPRTRIESTVGPGVVRFPAQAVVEGSLRRLTGEAVGGAPVEVQAFAGRAGWRTVARTTTAQGGTFRALVSPAAKRVLRARYPGGQGLVGSTSRQGVVLVRPALRASRSVSQARIGRTPVIGGTVGPAKRRLLVIVQRRVGGRDVRVARLLVRPRAGRFRVAYRLRRPGLHRFSVVFGGDAANLPASATPVYVRAVGG